MRFRRKIRKGRRIEFKVKLEEASRERGNADAAKAKAMAEVINLKDRTNHGR